MCSNNISNSYIMNFWMNSCFRKHRDQSIHDLCKFQWIYPWNYFNFILKSQCGICGRFWTFNFDRSGPCGKFSISNFHRSGIGLKNVDLCSSLVTIYQICLIVLALPNRIRIKTFALIYKLKLELQSEGYFTNNIIIFIIKRAIVMLKRMRL